MLVVTGAWQDMSRIINQTRLIQKLFSVMHPLESELICGIPEVEMIVGLLKLKGNEIMQTHPPALRIELH